MARTTRRNAASLALLLGLLAGCSATTPAPEKVTPAPVEEATVDVAKTDESKTDESKTDESKVVTPPPLSEEDLALIAMDPKDLTPEMRRKRAYARRRQIMQNPDSPTARALNDLAEAHQAGEIDVARQDSGPWISAPGTKPTSGRPPAGWRPPAKDAVTEPAADAPSQP